MLRKLSVVLVEDDDDTCKKFIDCTDSSEDVELIKVTNNSVTAVKYVQDYQPDVVILDLELHRGSGNGLLFLKDLKKLSVNPRPYILITTNNSSSATYDSARKLGADFIMYKHQENYSVAEVIDFLSTMKPVIQNRTVSETDGINTDTPHEREKRITQRICSELDLVSVSHKAVGYNYLVEAIKAFIEKPVPNICVAIGNKYGKTESSVERAMQNAIARAWSTAEIDDLLNHYTAKVSSKKGVPTITEFICYYADKIRNEYQ